MERNVKQMLKLIEEGGDSFAQKAEMYYQKRPELISLVEEFYRGYKSLVERIDHNNNTPCDVLSLASCVSDNGSEPPSHMPSPRKMGRRICTNRAAGFDVFLGSGGNVQGFDACQKDGDGSSTTLTESDEDYDDASSINSLPGFFGSGNDQNNIHRRVMDLETELAEGKENNGEDLRGKIIAYEQELRNVNEKLRLSEGEISRLRIELEKYRSMESENLKGGDGLSSIGEGMRMGGDALELKKLEEELRLTKEKLESSEVQIVSLKFGATKSFETIQQLQEQLDLAQKDIASWKNKLNTQKRENSKLQERLAKMRNSIAERDQEIRNLKTSLSDVEQKIFFERANMKSEMTKLMGGQTLWEKKKELECQCQSSQEEIRNIHSEKVEMEGRLKGKIDKLKEDIEEKKRNIENVNVRLGVLKLERDNLNAEIDSLKEVINLRDNEIEKQRVVILESAEEKREAIRQLCFSLEHYRNGYKQLRQAFIWQKSVLLLAN
uniref:NAB domain-containing protein n=2 Tax=Cajanus cajan TaxID=3821 RepID=A0A151U9T0_CAJCA|nr:hypothetical protein KK1_020302 [Cajanus cajan]